MLSHYMPVDARGGGQVRARRRASATSTCSICRPSPRTTSCRDLDARARRPRRDARGSRSARVRALEHLRRLLAPGRHALRDRPRGLQPGARLQRSQPARTSCARCGAGRGVRSIPPRRWSARTTSSSTAPKRCCSSWPTPYAHPDAHPRPDRPGLDPSAGRRDRDEPLRSDLPLARVGSPRDGGRVLVPGRRAPRSGSTT